MSININSETSCRNAYLNYYCHNNSMNITDEEIAEIKNKWSGKLTSWQASVSNDDNEYDFGDDDDLYLDSKDKVAHQVEKDTGFDGEDDKTASDLHMVNTMAAGVGAAGMAVATSVIMAAKGASQSKVRDNTWLAAAAGGVLLASAIAVNTADLNRKAAEACQQLTQEHLPNAQGALAETQCDMEDSVDELSDLSDDAITANEEANSDIKEKKADYDAYKTSFENLKAKVESGEPLTEEEKSLWQSLVQYMTLIGEDIGTIQTDTSDAVGEIYEEMETHQETFDYAAETMEEVEGVTDYAESFDEATADGASNVKFACTVGIVGAGLITTAGAIGFARGASKGWAGIGEMAAGSVAIGAGVSSGILFQKTSSHQKEYEDMANTEIDLRRETQNLNGETSDLYDDDLDAFDNFKTDVEDLELEIPDEIAPPEETAPPTTPSDGFPTGTPDALKPTGQNGQNGTTGNNGSTPQAGGATQQGEATQGGTQPATGGTNAQPAATQPLFTAGAAPVPGNSNMPKIVLPAECATAITSAQGLPMATNGNAFDPAIIPDIIAKLAPEYDIQTIQNVLNGVQTPANQGVNGNEDTNQPDLQGLKNKIALYKPLLQQAAINGWKC